MCLPVNRFLKVPQSLRRRAHQGTRLRDALAPAGLLRQAMMLRDRRLRAPTTNGWAKNDVPLLLTEGQVAEERIARDTIALAQTVLEKIVAKAARQVIVQRHESIVRRPIGRPWLVREKSVRAVLPAAAAHGRSDVPEERPVQGGPYLIGVLPGHLLRVLHHREKAVFGPVHQQMAKRNGPGRDHRATGREARDPTAEDPLDHVHLRPELAALTEALIVEKADAKIGVQAVIAPHTEKIVRAQAATVAAETRHRGRSAAKAARAAPIGPRLIVIDGLPGPAHRVRRARVLHDRAIRQAVKRDGRGHALRATGLAVRDRSGRSHSEQSHPVLGLAVVSAEAVNFLVAEAARIVQTQSGAEQAGMVQIGVAPRRSPTARVPRESLASASLVHRHAKIAEKTRTRTRLKDDRLQ